MRSWLFVTMAFVVGGLAPIQGSLNAQMGRILGHPLRGTLMNFVVGRAVLLAILAPLVGFPAREDFTKAPWYLYTAGFIGVLRVLAAVVVGQLIVSAAIDHWVCCRSGPGPVGKSDRLDGSVAGRFVSDPTFRRPGTCTSKV